MEILENENTREKAVLVRVKILKTEQKQFGETNGCGEDS